MHLPLGEFIRRLRLHLLPPRFVKIRHYGLLANRGRQVRLQAARALLPAQSPADQPLPELQPRAPISPTRPVCPHCGWAALSWFASCRRCAWPRRRPSTAHDPHRSLDVSLRAQSRFPLPAAGHFFIASAQGGPNVSFMAILGQNARSGTAARSAAHRQFTPSPLTAGPPPILYTVVGNSRRSGSSSTAVYPPCPRTALGKFGR